jgi:NADP-dependent aldehyde dehydrogenase
MGIRSPQFTAFLESLADMMADQPPQTMLNAGTLGSYALGLQKLLDHPRIEHLAGKPQQGRQAQLSAALNGLHGQLTATIIGEQADFEQFSELTGLLEQKVGRILLNGYPTGVEVCDSMVHGGPYPATSDARGTSVGTLAIDRFLRPVCFQNYPDSLLPDVLKNANPLGIQRLVDGKPTRDAL